MEFNVRRTSEWSAIQRVTINSLEELLAFLHEAGHAIILSEPNIRCCDKYWIEIYDDYRE